VTTLSGRTKFFYGLGALALGVRDTGFNGFLLVFYSQVLGLPAALAGLALMLTLLADAVLDPLIGMTSDHWRSRLGRRHPFLYAAIIPAALAHYFLWCPPIALSGMGVFWYLLGASVVARFCISLFEVPFAALAAEFTRDYDDRTALLTYLFVFGWWGGLSLAVLSYAVFFAPTAGDPSGMLHPHGFAVYGVAASLILLASMLAAAIGSHSTIPTLERPPATRPALRQSMASFGALLANRSVASVFIATVLLAAAQGFGNALYNYVQLFFWQLTAPQISILSLAPFVSATLAFLFTARLTAGRDKRNIAVAIVIVAVIGQPLPILLRLADAFPANGARWLMPILAFHSAFETAVWVMFSIVSASMVADLVEDNQRRTAQRSEGALFALRILAQKAVSGLGLFLSGIVLQAIGLTAAARPGHVPQSVLTGLALAYVPIFIALGLASAACLLSYRITRKTHEANLALLANEQRASA
jgi:Na+/melibiose symporter-like transporter